MATAAQGIEARPIGTMMGDLRNYQFLGQFVQTEADRQMTAVQKIIQKYQ